MIYKKYLNILNPKELFLKDRIGLMKELVKASLFNFPFQNMTSFGRYLPYERLAPGFQTVLQGTLHGKGGMCGHLNTHMKLQLESLGFHTELIGGCFRRTGIPVSHFLVKVKIPGYAVKEQKGEEEVEGQKGKDRTYLVDVGCGIPLEEPIWLENLPYHGKAGGLNYRYERVDENTVRRVNENGDALMGEKPSTYLSPQDYTIELQPRKFQEFAPRVDAVYGNPRSVFVHQGIYCFRYLSISNDDFQAVCARGKEIIWITKETREVQTFSSYTEMKPSIFKYFPMIPKEDVELTVKHFEIPFEQALKMTSTSPEYLKYQN